jgi:hypothetical protein
MAWRVGRAAAGPIDIGDAKPDWIITGGESGPGFRPLDMDAVRSLRDQCARNGITFHHKQNGGIRGKDAGCLVDGVEHKHFPPAARTAAYAREIGARLTRINDVRMFIDEIPADWPMTNPIVPACDFLCHLAELEPV